MIQNSYEDHFNDLIFSLFINCDFEYAECSTCSDRLNLDLYENTNGFLTEYSKSIPSEDMAEIFSFLMVNKNLIEDSKKNTIVMGRNTQLSIEDDNGRQLAIYKVNYGSKLKITCCGGTCI